MLYLYTGTDREKARAAMDASVKKVSKKDSRVVRITDANALADLRVALQGAGMFGESRVVVLDNVFANEETAALVEQSLPSMKESSEHFFILEEKPLADVRKKIEKYAETSERLDAPGKGKDNRIFELADALKRGDKKVLWVGYQRALLRDEAPEAIHGVLFLGAKQMLLAARAGSPERIRGSKLVAELAELPHSARRKGCELEYALEQFVLSRV